MSIREVCRWMLLATVIQGSELAQLPGATASGTPPNLNGAERELVERTAPYWVKLPNGDLWDCSITIARIGHTISHAIWSEQVRRTANSRDNEWNRMLGNCEPASPEWIDTARALGAFSRTKLAPDKDWVVVSFLEVGGESVGTAKDLTNPPLWFRAVAKNNRVLSTIPDIDAVGGGYLLWVIPGPERDGWDIGSRLEGALVFDCDGSFFHPVSRPDVGLWLKARDITLAFSTTNLPRREFDPSSPLKLPKPLPVPVPVWFDSKAVREDASYRPIQLSVTAVELESAITEGRAALSDWEWTARVYLRHKDGVREISWFYWPTRRALGIEEVSKVGDRTEPRWGIESLAAPPRLRVTKDRNAVQVWPPPPFSAPMKKPKPTPPAPAAPSIP